MVNALGNGQKIIKTNNLKSNENKNQ